MLDEKRSRVRARLREVLSRLLEAEIADSALSREKPGNGPQPSGLIADWGRWTLAVEYRGSGQAAHVALAALKAQENAQLLGKRAVPIVAVLHMGETGAEICRKQGISWFDLSGNANLDLPGFRLRIKGEPRRFATPGRPPDLFAPRSARIPRLLLLHPREAFRQREIARLTGLTEGYTSRLVERLVRSMLAVRESSGVVRVRDPNLLLDAWREAYNFNRHEVIRGYFVGRSSDEILGDLVKALRKRRVYHAATGLPAAWLYDRHAGFNLVTLYLKEAPPEGLFKEIGFNPDPDGANVWLAIPNDPHVFAESRKVAGVECVSPLQVYLDLKDHPERSKEAAEELRKNHLSWRSHA
jgi:hypothetical protein